MERLTSSRPGTRALVGLTALAVLTGAAGCGDDDGGAAQKKSQSPAESGARIETGATAALADTPVRVRVRGLEAKAPVTVSAQARDRAGQRWSANAAFTADAHGTLRLTTAQSGKLLTSMLPSTRLVGSGKAFSLHPGPPGKQRSYGVKLSVTSREGGSGSKPLAERVLKREWLPKGATHRKLTVAKDKIAGDLYNPPKGSPRKAPVLVFGGSEGGNAGTYTAALLAARGHPAMSLCYFKCGQGSGRPNAIDMIDLDYFSYAARLLDKQPAADAKKLAVMGNSRGSEVAQHLGQRRPSLVRDVIAYAPSSKANGPYLGGTVAWADGGKPLPQGPLPLDRVRGTVLAIGGTNDRMWGSAASADEMARRGAKKLVYRGAGHHVNWFPYGQPGQEGGADGKVAATSRADQRARAGSWPQVLKLLSR